MRLPCIKFITFTLSYTLFIVMMVIVSLRLQQDYSTYEKFSHSYPNFFENYTNYFENKNLSIRFGASDFFIRNTIPNSLDLVVCIWLFGIYFKHYFFIDMKECLCRIPGKRYISKRIEKIVHIRH